MRARERAYSDVEVFFGMRRKAVVVLLTVLPVQSPQLYRALSPRVTSLTLRRRARQRTYSSSIAVCVRLLFHVSIFTFRVPAQFVRFFFVFF